MRRKDFSASRYADAIQRSTICGSRQRQILPVTRRTAPLGFSMMLVVHKQRISAGVSLSRLTVKVSSNPCSPQIFDHATYGVSQYRSVQIFGRGVRTPAQAG